MKTYKPVGIKEAGQVLSLSDKFLVYYDPDVDGAVSGEFICRFLKAFGKQYSIYINENREHGFKLPPESVAQLRGMTMILVDATMTKAEVEYLVNNGVNVINIDHHHLHDKEFVFVENDTLGTKGVIINNQYPFEPEEWRFLSGAGVVYFVLNGLYAGFCGADEKALVGLTLLSDVRPLGSDLANDFLHSTYTRQSPMIEYLINVTKPERDFGFGVLTFDRNYIDYTFSPKINALFRLNKGYEAIKVFNGTFTNVDDLPVYRKIQNACCDVILDNLDGYEKSNLVVKSVPSTLNLGYTYNITNFVGLSASKELSRVDKTTLLFIEKDGKVLRGSVRGFCEDVDYLELFRKHGFDAEGHPGAFGVKGFDFDAVDLDALNADIVEKERGYSERKYVDRVIQVNNLAFFMSSKDVAVADYNNYVRDNARLLLKYTGTNVESVQRGRATEFTIDGIKVMGFEDGLTPENGLIMPLRERGKYVTFYLKKY